jgi:hypothetical protein
MLWARDAAGDLSSNFAFTEASASLEHTDTGISEITQRHMRQRLLDRLHVAAASKREEYVPDYLSRFLLRQETVALVELPRLLGRQHFNNLLLPPPGVFSLFSFRLQEWSKGVHCSGWRQCASLIRWRRLLLCRTRSIPGSFLQIISTWRLA